MKTSKRNPAMVLIAVFFACALAVSPRLSAETARWSVEVRKLDPGDTSVPPFFQAAIYENILEELIKSKQFDHVLRDGDSNSSNPASLLVLKITCEKYTAGSETRRAVTTISGATKLTVAIQLVAPDDNIVLDRSVKGNVLFIGSSLRATHNLARNIVKSIKKSSLPQASPVVSKATGSGLNDDIVVVRFQ